MHSSTLSKEVCAGCQQPIADRYIMRVMDGSWHENCLQCSVCHAHLSQSCYTRDRKLFCKSDYDKLYGVKCTGCRQFIPPSDLVMRALDNVYHLPCFVCVVCGNRLQKGDQFVIRNGQLFCRPDFEREMSTMQASPKSDGSLDDTRHSKSDGRRGPKRPRTILTTQQRRAFKQSFEISSKPCRKVRESLAKETGLSVRIVQVWFQNQRAKMKKLQKKQNQENGRNGEDSCGSQGVARGKGKKAKTESSLNSYPSLTPPQMQESSTDSTDYPSSLIVDTYPDTGTPGHVYSPRDKTTDYYKSEVAVAPESCLEGLDDVLIGSSPVPPLPAPPNHLYGPPDPGLTAGGLNPIDRLYSMQTSYFTSADCDCVGTDS